MLQPHNSTRNSKRLDNQPFQFVSEMEGSGEMSKINSSFLSQQMLCHLLDTHHFVLVQIFTNCNKLYLSSNTVSFSLALHHPNLLPIYLPFDGSPQASLTSLSPVCLLFPSPPQSVWRIPTHNVTLSMLSTNAAWPSEFLQHFVFCRISDSAVHCFTFRATLICLCTIVLWPPADLSFQWMFCWTQIHWTSILGLFV